MAVEPHDTERLNAFVDGELSPAERAAMAERLAADRTMARAHATLARLKASVVALADAEPAHLGAHRRSRRWRRAAAFGGAAAAVLAVVWLVLPDEDRTAESSVPHAAITLAALPASPVVPHLDQAGLTLTGVAVETPGGRSVVVATYLGPRGCRLELHAAAAGGAFPGRDATSRHQWTAGALVYQLVAFGMPEERFRAVADAAERATQGVSDGLGRRLREARRAALPCTA
jgi:hypothetical protein